MIKDTMERDMINEISALFVMIFTAGLMFVMPMLDIECDDITIIIGSGIILSFMLTIIPILLSRWQFCHYDKPQSAEAFLSIIMLM